jgi:hypothetical protein
MPSYKAPLRDIQFVINEVLDTEALYAVTAGYEEATPDLMKRDHRGRRQVRRECALAAQPER